MVSDKQRKKTKNMPKRKWCEDYYVTAYELARSGLSDNKIAEAMGVSLGTLRDWRIEFPAFTNAIRRGKAFATKQNGTVTFRDYVYKRLPPDLRELWDKINACERHTNGIQKIEALFAEQGLRARQHLFLYALTASNFNASLACRKVGISRQTMLDWKERDPSFSVLLDEIDWHKGNFFESALIRAVKEGDTSTIMMANRTFNKNRGYGTKVEVEHTGEVNHNLNIVNLDAITLPIEVRRQLLEAIKAADKLALTPTPLGLAGPPIEVLTEGEDD